MNQNIQELTDVIKELNRKYVGWYMFLENGALPGEAKFHAFSKSNISENGIKEIVSFLKRSAPLFHLTIKQGPYAAHPAYFVFRSEGYTRQYKTLALVIDGRSLNSEGKKILDVFLQNKVNADAVLKYNNSAVRHPSEVFRLNMRGKGSFKIHNNEPTFKMRDEE